MTATDFWSRRKASVAAEQAAEDRRGAADERVVLEAEQAAMSDEELLEEFGLPDPDTLECGGDFKSFLREGVPARLKTRALRRLWRVDPGLANLDGLIDYGGDFTDSAMVVENLQTAYQVGKGMARHVAAMLEEAESEAGTDADIQASEETLADAGGDDGAEADVPTEMISEPATVAEAAVQPAERALAAEMAEDDAASAVPMRRMRFVFDDGATAI